MANLAATAGEWISANLPAFALVLGIVLALWVMDAAVHMISSAIRTREPDLPDLGIDLDGSSADAHSAKSKRGG